MSRSDVVFTGVTLAGGDGWRTASARFRVLRAYKGVRPGNIVDVETAAQTSCAAIFDVGQEYVVFAERNAGRISTNACRGSRPVSSATAEIRYIELWGQKKTPTEIVGDLFLGATGAGQGWPPEQNWTRRAVIRVQDEEGLRLTTSVNERGTFAVTVPRPGTYDVSVSLPNWMTPTPRQSVIVPPHGCGDASFAMRPDGQILGSVVEADGSPARDVLLKLLTTGEFRETLEIRTDHKGEFRLHGVLGGSYWLGVNAERLDDPSVKVPYAPTLYPGVSKEKDATVIRLREFEVVRLPKKFQLPPRGRPRAIQVAVTDERGRPIAGVSVSCTPAGRSYWRKELTDAKGLKTFQGIDTVEYIIDADIGSDHPLASAGYERSRWLRISPARETALVQIMLRNRRR